MTSDELRTRFEVLTAALAQLPPTPAITWRGYDGSTAFGTELAALRTAGLTATTRDLALAVQPGAIGVFLVVGESGRDLTAVSTAPQEQEVVYLPGTVLAVRGQLEGPGMPIVVVHELVRQDDGWRGPALAGTDLITLARDAVRDLRSGAPRRSLPEKFCGEIV
ncbi:hypothetical protein [Arsenicicoccus dermatophilus]|uniref:hypothetical protein n=1 Tax=Arsenicicoccus dermatophilus TaxID=1076331 RepID=UPI003916D4D6